MISNRTEGGASVMLSIREIAEINSRDWVLFVIWLLKHAEYFLLCNNYILEFLNICVPIVLAEIHDFMYFLCDLRFLGLRPTWRLILAEVVPSQLLAPLWTVEPCFVNNGLLGYVGFFDVVAIAISACSAILVLVPCLRGVIFGINRLMRMWVGAREVLMGHFLTK